MAVYDRFVNNMSYTNKDFNSIYSELLDLVDSISPKWKPSQSNESDPGVLLLKLAALIGDKANYNIDKNILELFPESVTQYPNAREIFEQCGYKMPYYRAAEVVVSLTLRDQEKLKEQLGGSLSNAYDIDRFTMVSSNDNTSVYTIVDPINIKTDQSTTFVKALQGIIKDYSINNSTTILYDSLDSNNRLYFSESDIAENGIYIFSKHADGSINYSTDDWKQVDNLQTQPLNTKRFKFGVSRDGGRCYIEFTSDIANLIQNGLHIKYILTDGYNGNIGKRVLSKFYSDKVVFKDTDLSLTSDLIYITNDLPSEKGADPETLADARKNYERVKTTFDTLVSLRDYTNFLKTSDQCSNGYVCDRTNDLQDTYKIISSDGSLQSMKTKVTKSREEVAVYSSSSMKTHPNPEDTKKWIEKPNMDAFDLKIYGTKFIDPVTSDSRFDLSFEPLNETIVSNIVLDMDNVKCIQHNIKSPDDGIVGIVLKYPISAKIVPQYKLDVIQQAAVYENIIKALYKTLNASKLEYGQEIDYNLVYDTIMDSDFRIKALVLDDFKYTPYIIIKDANGYKWIDISDNSPDKTDDSYKKYRTDIKAKCILAGVTPWYSLNKIESDTKSASDTFTYSLNQKSLGYEFEVDKVTTKADITLTQNKENKYCTTVQKNELIYLSAPNYITTESYSTYTKYVASIKLKSGQESIPKDSIYQLKDNDYVIFFWSEDANSGFYNYKKYTAGTYISVNFDSFKIVLPTAFNLTLGNYGTTTSDQVKDLRQILDGTKAVAIKKPNTILLSKSGDSAANIPALPRAYWVLNKSEEIENEYKYVLFRNNETTYTLQSGEYLFYTDPTNTKFAMVGEGTEISRNDTFTSQISVKAIPYDELMLGQNNLLTAEDLWYSIPSNATITLNEMQFYSFGEDTELIFSDLTAAITIDNTPDEVASGILYKTSGSDKFTAIPLIVGDHTWKIRSYLNIDCGPDKTQELLNNDYHKHSITAASNASIYNPYNSDTPVKIRTNYPVKILGGENIDITYRDILGNSSKIAFYKFSDATISVQNSSSTTAQDVDSSTTLPTSDYFEIINDDITIKIPKNIKEEGKSDQDINISIAFTLPSGHYLLPIIIPVTYNNVTISPNTTINSSTVTTKGLHFINLTGDTATTLNITVKTGNTSESKIILRPLIKYTNPVAELAAAETLDFDKEFDYSYKVDQAQLIEDPLSADAFLNPYHPFNKYVLCKWDHDNNESMINITNKIR